MSQKVKTQQKKAYRKSTKKKKTKAIVKAEERQLPEEIKKFDLKDPRQSLFLQLYYDRESPTWGNAKQSAVAAGFDEDYADQITYRKPKWWLGFVRQEGMADLIEKHFHEVMTLPTVSQAMGAFGPITQTVVIDEPTGEVYKSGKRKGEMKTKKKKMKMPVMVPNISVIKAKTAVAKIAAPAHDPDRYGKKDQGNNVFNFNFKAIKNEYA